MCVFLWHFSVAVLKPKNTYLHWNTYPCACKWGGMGISKPILFICTAFSISYWNLYIWNSKIIKDLFDVMSWLEIVTTSKLWVRTLIRWFPTLCRTLCLTPNFNFSADQHQSARQSTSKTRIFICERDKTLLSAPRGSNQWKHNLPELHWYGCLMLWYCPGQFFRPLKARFSFPLFTYLAGFAALPFSGVRVGFEEPHLRLMF